MGRFGIASTEEQENARCPDGIHVMRVSDIDDSKATKNGDWMAKVTFKVVGGEHKGMMAVDYIIIPEANSPAIGIMWKARTFLKAIGEPHKGKLTGSTDNWDRKVVKCEVKADTFEGKHGPITTAKVIKYLPLEGAESISANSTADDENVPF